MAARVALVTGANQGIGLEIVRQLCKQFGGTVLLAARNASRGEEAVKQLHSEGLKPELLVLDVDNIDSIRTAKDEVETKFGRLDVLVNNAGILIRDPKGDKAFSEAARSTIRTNYYGFLNVSNTFYPLLQPNSRVVHMTSMMGNLSHVSEELKRKILSPELTVDSLTSIMDQFVKVSKIGVSRLTELQAKTFSTDPTKAGILVNAVCPGWVRTQMGTYGASKSVEQGADTPVYLALLPPGVTEPNGQMLQDRKLFNWK